MKASIEMTLFDPGCQENQPREIRRVDSAIKTHVLSFCRRRIKEAFHAQDLETWVRLESARSGKQVAPGSAGRILRKLHRDGVVRYQLLGRRKSHYRIVSIEGEE